jgi:hypothetical protein
MGPGAGLKEEVSLSGIVRPEGAATTTEEKLMKDSTKDKIEGTAHDLKGK